MAEIPALPSKTGSDLTYEATKVLLAAVPGAGSAVEIMSMVFGSPLEKRRDKWLQLLAEAFNELHGRVSDLTPEKLSQNDAFVSTALHASQIATRTHQNEKLEALKNAVIHSGQPGAPEASIQQIFLSYVDRFTPWHLVVLSLFDGPEAWLQARSIAKPKENFSSRTRLLETFCLELRGRQVLYDQVVRDLHVSGLLAAESLHGMLSSEGPWQKITTPFGSEFLRFVSSDKQAAMKA